MENGKWQIAFSVYCLPSTVYFIDGSSARWRTTRATFSVRVKRGMVIDRKFLARCDIAKRHHQNVIEGSLHVTVRFAGVVDIVRTVPTATAVQTPAAIDVANP